MHLRVLRDAGLVSARADGTRRLYQLEPVALADLRDYLDWYWTRALEAFKEHVEAEGDTPMQPELKVTKSIVVDVTPMRAFEFFLQQERWWPINTHRMGKQPCEAALLEPFVGGRWFERARDGSEIDWGRVLAFDPPRRILLSWHMSANWDYEPDADRASEIEVTFLPEGRDRTRVVYEHRHLERYGKRAERMRAGLDRPNAAEAVLHAFDAALATTNSLARRRKLPEARGAEKH
jgi:uncharacterized protein YndB with AHSA1/START domain